MGFSVVVDAAHGGRWTSLRDPGGREWLWARPDPARETVTVGDAFVDVGGVEECLPTIGGTPDHGDVWTRPWRAAGQGWLAVRTGHVLLSRRVTTGDAVVADYRLRAPAGYRFVWALHALLRPEPGTAVEAPQGHPVRAWPGHTVPVDAVWPQLPGAPDYYRLGPDDGTAMFCLLPGLRSVVVRAPDRSGLRIALDCPGQPTSMGLWRNLGGYPWGGMQGRYRNFGVEPMLGRVFDLSAAGPGDAAVMPAAGKLRWRVTIESA